MNDREALLSTSPWVKAQSLKPTDLSDEDIALLQKIGIKRIFAKGSVVLPMGSRGEYMYFVQKGIVRYSLLSSDGTEKPVTYVNPGCFLGEEPFFHNQPTLYNAVAIEDVEALAISRKNLTDIISRPGLAHILLNSLSFKSRILATQIEDLAFRNTLEKVCRILYCVLAENPDEKKHLTIGFTQQELASIVGAHRVSITNAISKLKKEGILKTNKDGSIVVCDWDKLKEKGFGI